MLAVTSDATNGRHPDREPLTRERILAKAIELADTEGIDKLSMRRLAGGLGYEVMSLYNHVANKHDLLEGMTDQVAAEIELPVAELAWDEAMRAVSRSIKDMLERHNWACLLWLTTLPGPARVNLMEWQLRCLADGDLSDEDAHNAFHAIGNHVIGYMLQKTIIPFDQSDNLIDEFNRRLSPEHHRRVLEHIDQHLSGDHGPSFDYVLDIIISGISGTSDSGRAKKTGAG